MPLFFPIDKISANEFPENVLEVNALWQYGMGHFNHTSCKIMHWLKYRIIKDILVPVFIKKSHGLICRCKYPYCVATLHPSSIADSMQIMSLSFIKFHPSVQQGIAWQNM
jgi:hypothetical protein